MSQRSEATIESSRIKRIVVVGSGASSSTPALRCLLNPDGTCATCKEAAANVHSKNHRLNPTMLIQVEQQVTLAEKKEEEEADEKDSNAATTTATTTTRVRNILVDCGKTFRESSLKLFAPLGVSRIHSVILTHDHADATLGLDDLREFSSKEEPAHVYCDARTLASMKRVFPYLFGDATSWVASIVWKCFADPVVPGTLSLDNPTRPAPPKDDNKEKATNDVSKEDVCGSKENGTVPAKETEQPATSVVLRVDGSTAFNVEGIEIVPLPVQHGKNYVSYGFAMVVGEGSEKKTIVYLSDTNGIYDETLAFLTNNIQKRDTSMPPITTVVLDMLATGANPSHFTVDESLVAARAIGAPLTIFVGQSHSVSYEQTEDFITKFEKEEKEEEASAELKMVPAYDGMTIYES